MAPTLFRTWGRPAIGCVVQSNLHITKMLYGMKYRRKAARMSDSRMSFISFRLVAHGGPGSPGA